MNNLSLLEIKINFQTKIQNEIHVYYDHFWCIVNIKNQDDFTTIVDNLTLDDIRDTVINELSNNNYFKSNINIIKTCSTAYLIKKHHINVFNTINNKIKSESKKIKNVYKYINFNKNFTYHINKSDEFNMIKNKIFISETPPVKTLTIEEKYNLCKQYAIDLQYGKLKKLISELTNDDVFWGKRKLLNEMISFDDIGAVIGILPSLTRIILPYDLLYTGCKSDAPIVVEHLINEFKLNVMHDNGLAFKYAKATDSQNVLNVLLKCINKYD